MQKTGIRFAGESITGLVRRHNEDNFFIAAPSGRRTMLAAVADGVGGHRHGEIASYITCRELGRAFMACDDGELLDGEGAERFLTGAVSRINRRIFRINFMERNPHPMSSTLVALLIAPEFAVMANVGDSRLYMADPEGLLKQLSTDHTLGNDEEFVRLRSGISVWARRSISRAVGSRFNLKVEIKRIPLKGGERFFLCSDGVYNDLDGEAAGKILRDSVSPRQTLDRVMREVLLRGAHDNVTAVSVFRP